MSPAQLHQMAIDCMLDAGCCEDPALCEHPGNRMTPLEFVEWALSRLGPPPRPRPSLSARGRARIVAGQARRRIRERGELANAAA